MKEKLKIEGGTKDDIDARIYLELTIRELLAQADAVFGNEGLDYVQKSIAEHIPCIKSGEIKDANEWIAELDAYFEDEC